MSDTNFPMDKNGPEFYDVQSVFDTYRGHRSRAESPNNNLEQPLLWDLIGNPKGLDVLDLGCGDARIAKEFDLKGAKTYEGIEGSEKMTAAAATNLKAGFSSISRLKLENFEAPEERYDLVISSLVFHYIEELPPLFRQIHRGLKPGGRLIFSVEHPVITSSNQALEKSPIRQAWAVDDYFVRGARVVEWMGDRVTKYHRTVEDFVSILSSAGFTLNSLKEADPIRSNFQDEALWIRRRRIPLFLFLAAQKN